MTFGSPGYFLLLIPAAVFIFLFLRGWIGKEAALRFSSVQLVKETGVKRRSSTRWMPAILRSLTFFFLILALARPQTGMGEEKSTRQVIDMVIALDVSGSMATLDFHPDNRLSAAKIEARRFIEARKNDRIGLVIFAGQSFTQCPLTVDHKAILTLLNKIQLGMMEDGTAIGLGLGTAVNRLKDSEAKSKIIVLLTDGINNSGEIDPLTAAELARQYKIKVYTIGIGKEGEALFPLNDPRFGPRLVKVQTQIDERTMREISGRTGGAYFRAQDERGLREIFERIDRLEKTEIKVERTTHYDEHYFWFLGPAILFLMLEIVWSNLLFVKIP